MSKSDKVIRVSAVVFCTDDGELLTVRKTGSTRFMLPGGKPEPGESPRQTAARECAEEIGVVLGPDDLTELGVFRAPAANEAGHLVEAVVFRHDVLPVDRPTAEIAELRWMRIDRLDPDVSLAPLLAERVIPLLLAGR
ncbi:NUDIX domain-containing protein [Gordonia sp. NB41Y]|uniref:NUDIX hydrolase n=1 Tax=Gordonia sp. NB41Y TaxID=875808 RepID=UPI0002BF3BB2|nr:NUDIX domain-containing protein [Gordonia sp. NB41Y]EMP15192.1 NUDIX hydrolase [Gordonia sp. NB41Y]WLP90620.1 NUDIX domain-containing protein [Gordonia sp. NB41Y]